MSLFLLYLLSSNFFVENSGSPLYPGNTTTSTSIPIPITTKASLQFTWKGAGANWKKDIENLGFIFTKEDGSDVSNRDIEIEYEKSFKHLPAQIASATSEFFTDTWEAIKKFESITLYAIEIAVFVFIFLILTCICNKMGQFVKYVRIRNGKEKKSCCC